MLFSMFIVTYLFLGGCCAGLTLVTSARSLLYYGRKNAVLAVKQPFNAEEPQVFRKYIARSYLVALVLILLSTLCLLFDLASPKRALMLFLHPTLTPISIGAYVIAATMTVLATLCLVHFAWPHNASNPAQIRKVCDVIAVPSALALMAYTGIFLAMTRSVPLWNTWLTVALFVLSATSVGYALSAIVQYLTSRNAWLPKPVVPAHVGHIVVLAAELLTVVAFIMQAVFRPEVAVHRSLELVMGGPLLGWFIGGVVLLGLVVPLAVEILLLLQERRQNRAMAAGLRFCLPADIACLIGGFLLRYCLVAAGMH